MRESLDEPVSVVFYYDARRRHIQPYMLSWNNQDYKLGKVDFWHKTRHGNTLIHHFSVADTDGRVYFKLALDSELLHWTIEEYMLATEMRMHYESYEA